jgi:hypothetical protein
MSWAVENWPVLGGFAAGMIAWGKTLTDVATSKTEIAKVKQDVTSMKDAIARIETHQEYTRTGIDEIKKTLKRL